MKPTLSDVHVNKPLTNIAVAYMQARENYVATQAFPTVPVLKQGDRYFVFDKGDLLRDEAQLRAPGTESAGSGVAIDNTPSYYCDVYAYHEDVSDQLKANADAPLSPERDSTENVMQKLMTKRERLWAASYFATSVWTTDRQGVASPTGTQFKQWDASGSDPITDIGVSKENIRALTGFMANTLVVGPLVWNILKNHSAILDRIKYTQKGIVTEQLVAPLLGVDKLLVANAIYNSAIEGQTAVMADIYGKAALLTYSAPAPSIRRPSAGYCFSWKGLIGSGEGGVRIKKFRMEHLESDRIEGEMAWQFKVVCADCGVYMYDAIS